MSNQAISQELKRVRDLKRALSSEVELLRSDMENGKIHLRVSQNKAFRQELAEKMIQVSHPAYSKEYQGWYMCNPIEGKIYYCCHSSFNQYSEDDAYRIISIEECFDRNSDYGLNIDWRERIEAMSDDYQLMVGEYLNEYELNEEDFDKEEFIEWVKKQPEYESLIQQIEESEEEEAVSFAYGEIKDEVVVKI